MQRLSEISSEYLFICGVWDGEVGNWGVMEGSKEVWATVGKVPHAECLSDILG